ncbi:MAG: UbiD family decarboxylase [Candidatus Rokubacteria bacterium]|nr:UbiD family decarboxylase [Candidatus Rokubacteria bacterium]
MAQDLRSYLDLIKRKRPEDLVIVSREVDPAYEITALVVKLEREARRRPVLLFEKVRGSRFPVLTNLHASRARLAAAMGVAPEQMLPAYLGAMERPTPPRSRAAPCRRSCGRGRRSTWASSPGSSTTKGTPAPISPPRSRSRRTRRARSGTAPTTA